MKRNQQAKAPATPRGLSTFHRDRSIFYGSLVDLLSTPRTNETRVRLKRRLARNEGREGVPALAELERALELWASAPETGGGHDLGNGTDMVCHRECDSIRHEALAVSGMEASASSLAELQALARLAERTAWTIANGDLLHASELAAFQHRFLEEHAKSCLFGLSEHLGTSESTFLKAVGRAIQQMVEDDLRFLDSGSGCAPLRAATGEG